MSKKIAIIGGGNAGLQVAKTLAEQGNTCILHSVVDSQFTELKEEVFKLEPIPDLKQPWIDPNEPVFNQQKHDKTCAKNRKKRKKRKRR